MPLLFFEKLGTSCIHLEQTHEVVRLFRDIVEIIAPRTILLTETNVPHEENISYFGRGDEAHMIYQLVCHRCFCTVWLREALTI